MKRNGRAAVLRIVIAVASVSTLWVVAFAGASIGSAAATTPTWEPDPNALGNLVFFNSAGSQITGGANLNHLFDFAVGTTAATTGADQASLYFAAPSSTNSNTALWCHSIDSAGSVFPVSSPAGVATYETSTGGPADSPGPADADLNAWLGSCTLDSTAGFANIIQVRVYDSGPGGVSSGTKYWESDIGYNTSGSAIMVDGVSVPANGWAQVYPGPSVTATTTSLQVSPTNTAVEGTSVTLTATVSPTAAGTVQFMDGAADLGTAQAVDTGTGMATLMTSSLAIGNHSFTAVFTPTNPASFSGSTSSAVPYSITPQPGGLEPLTPARVMDTRSTHAVGAGATVPLTILGHGGVPASGVGAVVLNVTVTQPKGSGFITVFPAGFARPNSSNLNFTANETIPNLVIAKVGTGGVIDFYNGSAGTVQLVVDVSGWFASGSPAAGGLQPLTPARLMDTRKGVGHSGSVGPGQTITLQVTSGGGPVPSGASAVVLNVTVTQPTSSGFITVWPAAATRPTASNLNYVANETIPNLVITKLSPGGAVSFYNGSAGTVQLIADASGYFTSGTVVPGGLNSITPARLMDTRKGVGHSGSVGPGQTITLQVTSGAGAVPTGAAAVVLNVTVTAPTGPGFISVWPAGAARPTASNLNFVKGETIPNLVIVKLSASGAVSFYNGSPGTVQLIADAAGYF